MPHECPLQGTYADHELAVASLHSVKMRAENNSAAWFPSLCQGVHSQTQRHGGGSPFAVDKPKDTDLAQLHKPWQPLLIHLDRTVNDQCRNVDRMDVRVYPAP